MLLPRWYTYQKAINTSQQGQVYQPIVARKTHAIGGGASGWGCGYDFPCRQQILWPVFFVFEGKDIGGVQHPQPQVSECRNTLQQLVTAEYGEKYLGAMEVGITNVQYSLLHM